MTLFVGALVVAIVVAAAQVALTVHGHLPPGGYALLGVLAGIGLVVVAKTLAVLGLQQPLARRRED